mmetsp:Transcript_17389/g.42582  ORF Transcript_17389/g.42582 Transcript_17389/m.42582 type:complete len:107 (+) Transcript_17389:88-408(+)
MNRVTMKISTGELSMKHRNGGKSSNFSISSTVQVDVDVEPPRNFFPQMRHFGFLKRQKPHFLLLHNHKYQGKEAVLFQCDISGILVPVSPRFIGTTLITLTPFLQL